jgi:hypothetical protein
MYIDVTHKVDFPGALWRGVENPMKQMDKLGEEVWLKWINKIIQKNIRNCNPDLEIVRFNPQCLGAIIKSNTLNYA